MPVIREKNGLFLLLKYKKNVNNQNGKSSKIFFLLKRNTCCNKTVLSHEYTHASIVMHA